MSPDLLRGLVQPDARSCGPSSVVAARMLLDADYAAAVRAGSFAEEVLHLHGRLTGATTVGGAAQLPWPRALGTPPWAVASSMTDLAGVPYRTRVARFGGRDGLLSALLSAVGDGRPVPFYVGDRWLPRHVVLAVAASDAGALVYNPARGSVEPMSPAAFTGGALTTFGRWTRPWFVVLPRS